VLDEEETLAIGACQTRGDAEIAAAAQTLEPLRKAEHIHIRKVAGRKDKLKFVRLPWDLFANEPNWVPPLEMDRMRLIDEAKNPFYKHATLALWTAEDEKGRTVGRIGAVINHLHNEVYKDKTGFVGLFDSIDDQQAANSLFSTAEDFLRSRGMTQVRGPVSPSINDEVGLLVEGFEYPAAVMMPYHPQYYQTLWDNAGYGKEKDLLAYRIEEGISMTPKLERVTNLVKERGKIRLRKLDMKRFDEEVGLIRDLYSRGWEENWGAVPLTDEEITMLAGELKQIIDPDFILFAEAPGKNGHAETIGFSLCVPDINQAFLAGKPIPKGAMNLPTAISNLMTKKKSIEQLRIILLGVMPEYRGRGIDALIYREIMEKAKEKGIRYGEASWVLEDNAMMTRAAQVMNGKPYKRYRVYGKPLYQGEDKAPLKL